MERILPFLKVRGKSANMIQHGARDCKVKRETRGKQLPLMSFPSIITHRQSQILCITPPSSIRLPFPTHFLQRKQSPLTTLTTTALILFFRFYQLAISPYLPKNCRFLPTCSNYAIEALQTLGPTKGMIVTCWRLLRCNPLGGRGYDPVRWPPVGWKAGLY